MKKYIDTGNFLVIALTMILFVIALFVKGFTHDLLLEAGVLLVSIKLILMNYKSKESNQVLLEKLNEMKQTLDEIKRKSAS
jgi:hypothetical protein